MQIQIDESGKIKLPKEFIKELEVNNGGIVNIDIDYYVDGIVITKFYPGCFFCNCGIDLIKINNKYICVNCIEILKNAKIGDHIYVTKVN